MNFGSAGVGTQTHLAAENFAHAAGIDITHVPYKGEAAALTDLIGGQIQMVTPNMGAAVPHLQQGKIRVLARDEQGARAADAGRARGRRGDSRASRTPAGSA